MPAYVLDTSAILALLNAETGYQEVSRILEQAREEPGTALVYLPFMALMETEYLMLRRHSAEDVGRYMAIVFGWSAQHVESDPAWRRQAASIKVGGRLSVADAWIAALALSLEATLVHKDPEFDRVQGLQVLLLPS